jgi:RNA polymerase-binding transcription factor DksA
MSVLCRVIGHVASQGRRKLDPLTFTEYSKCKNCHAPIKRERRQWKMVAEARSEAA